MSRPPERQHGMSGARCARRRTWLSPIAAARLALYGLREAIAAAREPVAVDFVAALTLLSDPLSLEGVAAALRRRWTPAGH